MSLRKDRIYAAAVAGFCLIGTASAPTYAVAAETVTPETYDNPDVWLCRPGRQDACTVDLDATIIAADGMLTRESYQADPNPPVDCFYVYPTVSNEPDGNADRVIEPEERRVVAQQFARFGAKCRLFAPMYRQVTITALRAYVSGRPIPIDRQMPYDDVAAAWHNYLEHDNQGRGVILVGHSQGSGVLTKLIAREIDGQPIQAKLISAILMGTSLPVPEGADIGGAFQHIPVCHAASQTGCVIAFADFRAVSPPPADTRFGHAGAGMQAVCANPAALGGGVAPLDGYFPAERGMPRDASAWTNPPQPIDTPFVKLPGLLTGECVADAHGSYLAVTLHPTEGGARVNDIAGDVIVGGEVQADWGLHLVDANLNMGNMVVLVGEESKAYLAKPDASKHAEAGEKPAPDQAGKSRNP
jgi:pimeloyl-ACP methyl ester carboxylesterase